MSARAEPTEVEVHISATGEVRPLSFTWRGTRLPVASVGRRWSDDRGDHWLVMTASPERIFELLRGPDGLWQVVGRTSRPTVV